MLLENLNTIKLVFEWGRIGEKIQPKFNAPQEIGPIHEKAIKKGHSGAVRLGNTISTPIVSGRFDFTTYEEIKPIKFVFRYASEGKYT